MKKEYIDEFSINRYSSACTMLYTLFLERQVSCEDPKFGLDSLCKDLKELTSTAFLCEVGINGFVPHYFLVHKTAASILYLYQAKPMYYSIFDSIERLDKNPISFDYLRNLLNALLLSTCQSYVKTVFETLFHYPEKIKPVSTIKISYLRCTYKPFEEFTPLPVPYNYTPLLYRTMYACFFITVILSIVIFREYYRVNEPVYDYNLQLSIRLNSVKAK